MKLKASRRKVREQLVYVVFGTVCLLFGAFAGKLAAQTRTFANLLNELVDSTPSEEFTLAATLVLCLVFAAMPMLVILILKPRKQRRLPSADVQNDPSEDF